MNEHVLIELGVVSDETKGTSGNFKEGLTCAVRQIEDNGQPCE